MEIIEPKDRRVTPQQAVKILREHGTFVTIDEAKLILDFLYKIGNLAVNQYVNIYQL